MEIIVEHGFVRDSAINHIKSRKNFMAHQKQIIIRDGKMPIKATYDNGGDCVFCGEAGRCPGWHTLREIKEHLANYGNIDF